MRGLGRSLSWLEAAPSPTLGSSPTKGLGASSCWSTRAMGLHEPRALSSMTALRWRCER